MSTIGHDLPNYYLKPGEMFIGTEPTLVTTLLGSCVSVIMFSQRHRIGAICHGLLPSSRGKEACCSEGECQDGLRYMECAIRLMLGQLVRLGIRPEELEVKVFGGSDMFSSREKATRNRTVGRQNLEVTFSLLERERLRLVASDVGGLRGRKIFFNTHTGEVFMKRLSKFHEEPCL